VAALEGSGWTDALDVLVVASLLYAAIRWMRRSEGALVAVGVVLVSGGWAGARALELELTTWAFQGVFALFAVVLAVLFQEELRRALETVAAVALGRRHDVRPRLDTSSVLADALFDLARRGVGALVILPGLQPLRRHLRGGVALDGALSAPLLESLFDPHSSGHDGAVLIENRRVRSFGLQLPLSREAVKLEGLGMRHAAALGLCERSDALCIAVSEERGAVSLAHAGALRPVADARELRARIDDFYRTTLPLARRSSAFERLWLANKREKLAALFASALLWWVFVHGAEVVEAPVSIPIELQHAPRRAAASLEPERVEVRLRGPRRALLWLRLSLALPLDAARARPGTNRFALSARDLALPRGVSARPFEVAVRVTLDPPAVAAR
jgi:DNA integrity scanning protein DisA with diadenylate cyclase activity